VPNSCFAWLAVSLAVFGHAPVGADPLTPESSAPAPRIEVERPEQEFGDVVRGRAIDVVFELRNAGDASLTLHAKPG
jgi:hypothetical protein